MLEWLIGREKGKRNHPVRSNMKNHVPARFDSVWWSVELPTGWSGHTDEECATFHRSPQLGVLQISSARKDSAPVTEQDLREFAQDRIPGDKRARKVTYGPFTGLAVEYSQSGLLWKERWLSCGNLLVYVTYSIGRDKEDTESEDVETILTSLLPTI